MRATQEPDISLPGENWKKIKDFPGYLISDFGRVWSNKSFRLVALTETHFCHAAGKGKPVYTNRGYLAVQITHKSGKQRHMRVHRLVALHFVKNPDPKNNNVVDHIDNDPFNNMAANLRWVSARVNLHAAVTDETQKYTRWLREHIEARDAAND